MKYLIFLLLALTLLTVDHPKVNEIRDSLVSLIGQAAEDSYAKDKIADLIGDELAESFASFKDLEEKYVKKITGSTDELMAFYKEYCETGKFNPNISSFNQGTVCDTIEKRLTELEEEITRSKR